MAASTIGKPFRKGDKVVATRDLPGVPEGTPGVAKMAVGITWPRYWVEWENGQWMGSVSEAYLVRAKDWPEYQRRREEERSRPPQPTKEEAQPAAASDEGAAGGAGKVPAHLLERSKRARERKAEAGN